MTFSPSELTIWAGGIALELALLWVIRSQWRDFPAFAAYCLFCFLRSATLLTLYIMSQDVAYFICYWSGHLLSAILLLLVAYEFLGHALRPWFDVPGDIWGGSLLLLVLAGLLGAVAAGLTMTTYPHAVMTVVKGMQRIVVFVLVAVFGWLLIFPRSIRTPWASPGHWVILGFVVSQVGQAIGLLLGVPQVGKVAFLIAQSIWVGSLRGWSSPDRARSRSSSPFATSR